MKMLTGCSSQIGRVVVALALAFAVSLPASANADTFFLETFDGDAPGEAGDERIQDMSTSHWIQHFNVIYRYSHVLVDEGPSSVAGSSYALMSYYDDDSVNGVSLSSVPEVELTAVVLLGRGTPWTECVAVLTMGEASSQIDNVGDMVWMEAAIQVIDEDGDHVQFAAKDGSSGHSVSTGWLPVAGRPVTYDLRALVTSATSQFFYRVHGASEWTPLGTLDGIAADVERLGLHMIGMAGVTAVDTIRLVTVPPPTPSGTVVVVR